MIIIIWLKDNTEDNSLSKMMLVEEGNVLGEEASAKTNKTKYARN